MHRALVDLAGHGEQELADAVAGGRELVEPLLACREPLGLLVVGQLGEEGVDEQADVAHDGDVDRLVEPQDLLVDVDLDQLLFGG